MCLQIYWIIWLLTLHANLKTFKDNIQQFLLRQFNQRYSELILNCVLLQSMTVTEYKAILPFFSRYQRQRNSFSVGFPHPLLAHTKNAFCSVSIYLIKSSFKSLNAWTLVMGHCWPIRRIKVPPDLLLARPSVSIVLSLPAAAVIVMAIAVMVIGPPTPVRWHFAAVSAGQPVRERFVHMNAKWEGIRVRDKAPEMNYKLQWCTTYST